MERIDRETLRRLEMIFQKLIHQFPVALPKIVEDVEDWSNRMRLLLEWLKGAVHKGAALRVDELLSSGSLNTGWVARYFDIRAGHPGLTRLVDAVASLELTSYHRPEVAVFNWIDEHASDLARLSSATTDPFSLRLALGTLGDDLDAKTLRRLIDAASDASLCGVPAGDFYAYAEALSAELGKAIAGEPFGVPKKKPTPTLGDLLYQTIESLIPLEPGRRRPAGRLVALLFTPWVRRRAARLAASVSREENRLRRLLGRLQHRHETAEERRTDQDHPGQLTPTVVRDGSSCRLLANVSEALRRIGVARNASLPLQTWERFLGTVPEEVGWLRPGLFTLWQDTRRIPLSGKRAEAEQYDRACRAVLDAFVGLFSRRGIHRGLVRHWTQHARRPGWRYFDLVLRLIDEVRGRDRRKVQEILDLLERTLYDRDLVLGECLLGSLVECAAAGVSEEVGAVFEGLAKLEDDYYSAEEISVAMALTQDGTNRPAIVAKVHQNENDALFESVKVLAETLTDDRLRRIVERWILGGRNKEIIRLAGATTLLRTLAVAIPELPLPETDCTWVGRYPAELDAPLRALHAAAPGAEEIARSLLKNEFPDQTRLERELHAVEAKCESGEIVGDPSGIERLRKRAENLRRRLADTAPVSPRRLENLARKLTLRAEREIVERYMLACRNAVVPALESRFGVPVPVERLFVDSHPRVLAGVLGLRPPARDWGLRLLLYALQDSECDFRDEPENARFLASLRARGIRVEPWLDGSIEITAETGAGVQYTLAFTRDVMDILLMGDRFNTCLSPNSFNFFSAITNAIDINKRVLYGKTRTGRVIGRALFALGSQGELLSYNRYAHEDNERFSRNVDAFAKTLARAMNTLLVDSAPVPSLVAKDWYDDGPVPLAAIYDLSGPGGAVQTLLRTADPAEIIPALVDLFGSEAMFIRCLGALASTEEARQRPEVLRILVSQMAFDRRVDLVERFRLAILARSIGERDLARDVVDGLHPSRLVEKLRRADSRYRDGYFTGIGNYHNVYGLLMDCNPSLAIRLLRRTRRKGVKSDEQEIPPIRREILSQCRVLLGRRPLDRRE